jgi:hypothetical protein
MPRWPRSKGWQATIALSVALLSAGWVFLQVAMKSFNNYYFPPHKAFPYPYPSARAAHLALFRDCGLTFVGVLALLYIAQRLFVSVPNSEASN